MSQSSWIRRYIRVTYYYYYYKCNIFLQERTDTEDWHWEKQNFCCFQASRWSVHTAALTVSHCNVFASLRESIVCFCCKFFCSTKMSVNSLAARTRTSFCPTQITFGRFDLLGDPRRLHLAVLISSVNYGADRCSVTVRATSLAKLPSTGLRHPSFNHCRI